MMNMLIIICILGVALGSFINALVWRVYQQSLPRKKRVASNERLSLSKGRSMCTVCQHELNWYDLFPVMSWVSLRGRCRYCQVRISWQYPLVEVLTAVLFVVSYLFWPFDLNVAAYQVTLGLWLIALVGLTALMVYDSRWMLLPDRIVAPVTAVAFLYAAIMVVSSSNIFGALINILGAVFVSSGIFYILFQMSAGRWIGGGDVKLGIPLGLFLGATDLACLMLFIASVLGLIYGLVARIYRHRLPKVVPFGPMLITATIICLLAGRNLLNWYMQTVLMI